MAQLHPALSFCEIEGRYLFLDLAGDRYFGLEGDLAEGLRAASAGEAMPMQTESLRARGLLVDDGGAPIEPCPQETCTASLLDEPPRSGSLLNSARHALAVAGTRRRLRRLGLWQTTEALSRRKAALTHPSPEIDALAEIAADFGRLDLFVTTHDQCLPRSLALAFHLVARGFAPTLVFGVRLGPFRAHCWLECDGLLVNDQYERVRHYRPIKRL